MNLEELFQEYKDISLNIIKILEDDLVEQLDSEFEKRNKILEEIARRNENKDVIRRLYEVYDLFKIDEEMQLKLQKSMNDVKSELVKIKKRKEANKSYNNINARSVYLSKKI
ncbi:hypothetical protein [Clostridium beijerinckii]|uniref:hypothetical protein n=1 Tax=Clostridium beijerinckii TaxID=1520 RepID=UPI00098C3871|nr:hypothetical protein [Clostridium beijerinckii]MBA8933026.1 hypothetical protein [Clostridium beijerinckii]NRU37229.1 hypothetical protein [Clostridium beijerinckii]NSA99492.1 hypothetical protein [Clostridium beijerinckii]OOM64647.1 hypothetical protein CLOBI_15020 [Clostridium beijerinckii]OOM72368.1 hypothetical protein CLBEIC_06940 [Clostridium beijerinckii]